MTNQTENSTHLHTLHHFETDLNHLHQQLIAMVNLVIQRLDQSIEALMEGDIGLAKDIIAHDSKLNLLETIIDNNVLTILAKHSPVAIDLRTVISTSKIASELEKLGDEISYFAKIILILYDPKTSDPNPKLLKDIVKIAYTIKHMLEEIKILLETNKANVATNLFKINNECSAELYEGIKNQLSLVIQDSRAIGRALDIMNILKSFELCGDYCMNIAKYAYFMIEGVDIHQVG